MNKFNVHTSQIASEFIGQQTNYPPLNVNKMKISTTKVSRPLRSLTLENEVPFTIPVNEVSNISIGSLVFSPSITLANGDLVIAYVNFIDELDVSCTPINISTEVVVDVPADSDVCIL